MIISPIFSFGLMVATLIGALVHLIIGGDGRQLVAMILAAWIGFALGQMIGALMGITILSIGSLYLFTGALGSLIAVIAAALLLRRGRRA